VPDPAVVKVKTPSRSVTDRAAAPETGVPFIS
jgi:hypothetical protein